MNFILLEPLKDKAEMLVMFVFVCTDNEDVINIHDGVIEITKHLVFKPLNCLGCFSLAKNYVSEFA